MSSDIGVGICYFVTLSLSVDYEPSESMIRLVRGIFTHNCFAVVELGTEGGKKHFHVIGRTNRRQDNIRRSIINLLKKEDYEVDDKYSVDVLPEPNMFWRLGYLLKDKDRKILVNDYTDGQLADSAEHYKTKPKRERSEKKGKTLTIRQLAQECVEQNCVTQSEIMEFLRQAKRDGRMPYDVYKKLGVKSFVAYITETFDQ